MRVVQVATTAGQSCGIGNFALNLAGELSQAGVDIDTVVAMPESAAGVDVVLIHYGSGVITPRDVEAIDRLSSPVVVCAHDAGAAAVADRAVGAIAMAPACSRLSDRCWCSRTRRGPRITWRTATR